MSRLACMRFLPVVLACRSALVAKGTCCMGPCSADNLAQRETPVAAECRGLVLHILRYNITMLISSCKRKQKLSTRVHQTYQYTCYSALLNVESPICDVKHDSSPWQPAKALHYQAISYKYHSLPARSRGHRCVRTLQAPCSASSVATGIENQSPQRTGLDAVTTAHYHHICR